MENEDKKIVDRKQNSTEKNSLHVKTVQSIDLSSVKRINIEHAGEIVITSKSEIQRYERKAKKLKETIDKYNNLLMRFKDLQISKANSDKKLEEYKEEFSKVSREKNNIEKENKELLKLLERERELTVSLSNQLKPFKQSQNKLQSKKNYLDDSAMKGIENFVREHVKVNGKLPTVKMIHEYVKFKGREMNNEKYMNISYETVRTAVKGIRNRF